MSNPFAYVEAVTATKRDVIREGELREQDYNPFMVNRALSYHLDTVLYADDMNVLPDLDKIMQYDYYLHSIRARKRFAKWHKRSLVEVEEILMMVYKYSRRHAAEAVLALTDEQAKQLIEKHGGHGG